MFVAGRARDSTCTNLAPSQADLRICRICLLRGHEDELGQLISPCLCKNDDTLKPTAGELVHQSCLDAWRATGLNPRNLTRCELCHALYGLPDGTTARQVHTVVWCALLVQGMVFLVLATVIGYIVSSSLDFELFNQTLGSLNFFVQGIIVTCYILGVVALGQCVVNRCMLHGRPEGTILLRMRETGARRRTWLARGRNWRDHSCDCCDCCPGYYDSLLLYWALNHQLEFGAGHSGCTCLDAGCCACDDCCFSATVGIGCQGLPFECPAGPGEEDSMMCCGIAAVVTLVTLAGGAIVLSLLFFAEVNHRVRICIASRFPVVEAGGTLEERYTQALSQLKVPPKNAARAQYPVRDSGAVAADVVGTPMGTV